LRPGAFADLLVVEGDPLANLGLLEQPERSLTAIMKGGTFHRNRLN
jgi:imidazolonepropionase-like amidohydrolase